MTLVEQMRELSLKNEYKQEQIIQESYDNVLAKIKDCAEQGKRSCIIILKINEVEHLKNIGFVVSEGFIGFREISW